MVAGRAGAAGRWVAKGLLQFVDIQPQPYQNRISDISKLQAYLGSALHPSSVLSTSEIMIHRQFVNALSILAPLGPDGCSSTTFGCRCRPHRHGQISGLPHS